MVKMFFEWGKICQKNCKKCFYSENVILFQTGLPIWKTFLITLIFYGGFVVDLQQNPSFGWCFWSMWETIWKTEKIVQYTISFVILVLLHFVGEMSVVIFQNWYWRKDHWSLYWWILLSEWKRLFHEVNNCFITIGL